jgi:hypothetical protein
MKKSLRADFQRQQWKQQQLEGKEAGANVGNAKEESNSN